MQDTAANVGQDIIFLLFFSLNECCYRPRLLEDFPWCTFIDRCRNTGPGYPGTMCLPVSLSLFSLSVTLSCSLHFSLSQIHVLLADRKSVCYNCNASSQFTLQPIILIYDQHCPCNVDHGWLCALCYTFSCCLYTQYNEIKSNSSPVQTLNIDH